MFPAAGPENLRHPSKGSTTMKTVIATLFVILGLVSVPIHRSIAHANASNDTLIAIDILLQPDQTMISKANAVNTRLRANYPGGIRWTPRTRLTSRCCSASCE